MLVCRSVKQCRACVQEWADRAALPSHIVSMLKNFPNNVHPMAQFSSAIAACNSESKFASAYSKGVKKTEFWEVCTLLFLVCRVGAVAFSALTLLVGWQEGHPARKN